MVGWGYAPRDISNWEDRWPAILRALDAPWDILALQEVEEATRESVVEGMAGLGLLVEWFEHPGRADGVAIAYDPRVFSFIGRCAPPAPKLAPSVGSISAANSLLGSSLARLRSSADHTAWLQ